MDTHLSADTTAPETPTDVELLYPLEKGNRHSSWVVRCGEHTAAELEVPAGTLTLTQLSKGQEQGLKAAERLCAMVAHPALLTVLAVTSTATNDQIWYEAAEAGTLADYCAAKGQLPLEQVSTLAHHLCTGLTHLHENHLAYSNFTAAKVVFTADAEVKLLAPDLDLRQAGASVLAQHKAENTAALAALLWLCLTGEKAAAQRFRQPLPLSVPEASETLAKTLEDAIDLRSKQPSLSEIAALFELAKDPEPLDLHLSAHQSVLPRLPAIRPVRYDPVPQQRFRKKPLMLGQLQDFSADKAKKISTAPKQERRSVPRKPVLVGAAVLSLLVAGGLAVNTLVPEHKGEAQGISAAPAEPTAQPSATVAGATVPSNSSTPPPDNGGRHETGEQGESFLAEDLSTLISTRSDVLASGAKNRIAEYAAPDSDLYRSDTALLGSDTAGQLKGTKIQLSTVESLEQTDTGVKATITVEAHGYQPQGSEAELATAGIVKDGDRVFQKVGISAQKTQDGRLLLETAEPIASGKQ